MSINCIECPSFLKRDEASDFFEIAAAGPMCARYGWVFGHSDKAAQAAVDKYSSTCSSRGLPRPTAEVPSNNFGMVYTSRPDLLVPTGETVSSCGNCINFDSKAHGCAAVGKMLFPERYIKEATGCLWAKPASTAQIHNEVGPILSHLTGAMVDVSVSITPKPAAAPTKRPNKPNVIKWPRNYESDAPVEDDQKHMIRAYRKVETRKGNIYLPIFQTDFFGDDAEKIPDPDFKGAAADPSLYIDHSGLLKKFAINCYKLDMNLLMTGEPGTGKSDGANHVAWMLNMPFVRLPYTESSEPDHFLGGPQYGDTGKTYEELQPDGSTVTKPILGTYFQKGLLPTWWQKPCVLLSDEINLPPEAILQAYRSMNDASRVLVVNGHSFQRHDYCFHMAAINPSHDFRNIGAKPMASADSSRWTFHKMPNPDEAMIRKVLVGSVERLDKETPDPFLLTTIIKIGQDLRNASREGRLPDFWTLRQETMVTRLAPWMGLRDAYASVYLDYVDDATKELCESFINSHIPSGASVPEWAT